jgi:hypothetical protein
VFVTEGVGPAVAGLLRPRIVVPRWVTMALPHQQSAVIAHEQSHLDARDPQLFTLALALLVFMPWNLPLWWQLRRLRYAIEVDCDARVLEGGIDPTHYGETLISVGERQSAYIGAVAAMSESKSFLEERLKIMFSKPVKWRRVGIAALACMSVALTAIAAQVSPPNVQTAESADPQSGTRAPGERVAIKLPTETLQRYVGVYQIADQLLVKVTLNGSQLMAQVSGQPSVEIYPETETAFFYKVVDAQIDFAADGSSAELHQNGRDLPMPRIDAATAAQIETTLKARVDTQQQTPGTEAALRLLLEGFRTGKPDYEAMTPELAKITREQLPSLQGQYLQAGALKSFEFRGVSPMGWDVYEVRQENGISTWRIHLNTAGKIDGAFVAAGP